VRIDRFSRFWSALQDLSVPQPTDPDFFNSDHQNPAGLAGGGPSRATSIRAGAHGEDDDRPRRLHLEPRRPAGPRRGPLQRASGEAVPDSGDRYELEVAEHIPRSPDTEHLLRMTPHAGAKVIDEGQDPLTTCRS
jgi:hypothetical protein